LDGGDVHRGRGLLVSLELEREDAVRITTVKEIMTDVVETLSVGDTLATARRQIERGGIRHLPVIDEDEHVIGLITSHRILEAWLSHGHPSTESSAQIAGDILVDMVMEKNVMTVDVASPAAEAARLLETNKFGSLPVTKDDKLVGIVTPGDFVRFALRHFEEEQQRVEAAMKSPRVRGKSAKPAKPSKARPARRRLRKAKGVPRRRRSPR
jgi:CBS domain-containing membrane protein